MKLAITTFLAALLLALPAAALVIDYPHVTNEPQKTGWPLTAEERDALPILARGCCLRFLLTRLFDWLNHPPGAMVTPKDPLEYWQRLRFHQGITGIGGYGLE